MTARRLASPLAVLALSLAGAGCAARPVAPAPAPVSASVAYDESRAAARADSLRAALLARAGWQTDADGCDPGVLRIFAGDTTAAARASTGTTVEALEELVVSRGLDDPPSPDLLRTIVAWESGGERPRWDVAAGSSAERRAIAPGLTGRFRNPNTKRCESYVGHDSATFVVPVLERFEAPRVKGVHLTLLPGDSALRAARTAYFARDSRPDATFDYARVGPLVTWGDYGVATVRRRSDFRSGASAVKNDAVSASYLFHRVDREWRLLAIARSW